MNLRYTTHNKETMKATNKQLAFCTEHNMSFDQFIGKDIIEGNLHLDSVKKLAKGFNPIVGGGLYIDSVKKLIKGFNPTVGGNLYMDSVKKLIKGFNPTVGEDLYMKSVTELVKGFNPTVGGCLWMNSVTKLVKGFNPIVGGSLCMISVTKLAKGFSPTVGGSLHLESLTELTEGFNPTVGRDLRMNSVTELIEGFNPTVGGHLFMDSVTELIEGFNPTVGYGLHMQSVTDQGSISFTKINGDFIDFKNGFVRCEGIFMEVDSHRGNVWVGHRIGRKEKIFLVTDGNQKYAHGETIKEAKEDLIFKVDGRRPDDFKHLNKKSILKMSEAIVAYRVITGACGFGVKDYIKNRLPKEKKEFSMAEVIELTKDEYGGKSFSEFIG
jgi:hypothetical protein